MRIDIFHDFHMGVGPQEVIPAGLQLQVLGRHDLLKRSDGGGRRGLPLKECDFLLLLGDPTLEYLILKAFYGHIHSLLKHGRSRTRRDAVSTTMSFPCRS